MRPITALASIPLHMWAWLWSWTYPLAKPAITETRESVARVKSVSGLLDIARFAIALPLMARSQHLAERTRRTSTALDVDAHAEAAEYVAYMSRWRNEASWRSILRESIVWSTLALWLTTWASIGASFILTGNFLFETHATPEAPGYVSNYFKVAALTFALPFAVVSAGLTALGITRRAE